MVFFVQKNKLLSFLKSDPDDYYKTFTTFDLHARNVKSVDEYISLLSKSVSFFSADEKRKIKKMIDEIDERIKDIKIDGFNGEKCSKLPWIIGCIDGDGYEGGLPHTRQCTIILPKSFIDMDTLVHEKVHVYQKIYQKEMQDYLSRFERKPKYEKTRANPDTNDWIYSDEKREYKCLYRSKKPKSIQDVTGSKYEHPFENLAYKVSSLFS
jgi:hypothetical protein